MVNLDCIAGNTKYPTIRIQAYTTEYYIEKDGAALILKWKAPMQVCCAPKLQTEG